MWKEYQYYLLFVFLFILSCDDKKDDDNSPFSIIGSWKYYYRDYDNEVWKFLGLTWDFRDDGRIYQDNRPKYYYYYCDTKNYLTYSINSINQNCNCITSSTLVTQKLTFEGSDTFLRLIVIKTLLGLSLNDN